MSNSEMVHCAELLTCVLCWGAVQIPEEGLKEISAHIFMVRE